MSGGKNALPLSGACAPVNFESVLVVGPPGAGKTHYVLERVREHLRTRSYAFRLIVPTSTMAEHLRHTLAREGFVFPASCIGTMASFVDELLPEPRSLSPLHLRWLVKQALSLLQPQSFQPVLRSPGLLSSLASTMEELSSAAVTGARLSGLLRNHPDPVAQAFASVYAWVEQQAQAQGFALRGSRITLAAEQLRTRTCQLPREVLFDGFFTFSEAELLLVEALASATSLSVTLPDWAGAHEPLRRLANAGLSKLPLASCHRAPKVSLIEAETQEHEAASIADQIVTFLQTGFEPRQIGIVVRAYDPYVPLLRSTLARFGIPARSYFSESLAASVVIRYLSGLVEAALAGWDHAMVLDALRLFPSGLTLLPQFGTFCVRVRQQLPSSGLAALEALANAGPIKNKLARLAVLDRWCSEKAMPAQWAERLAPLGELLVTLPVEPAISVDEALQLRQASAALEAYATTLRLIASLLPPAPIALAEFWEQAKWAIQTVPLPSVDRRRNVVHILQAHEARQWELPVVFVCGLLEGQFPQHHSQNPFLNDELLSAVRRAGISVRTSAEKEAEEEFLFQLALTRATGHLVLSYPRFNAKAEPTLRSFLLDRFLDSRPDLSAIPWPEPRAQARGRAPLARPVRLGSPDLLTVLAARHRRLSATSLEDFLQCPFLFYSRQSLRLAGPPADPRDRLDARVQGEIVHRVLQLCLGSRENFEQVFEAVFSEITQRENIPVSYRTEAVRRALLRNLRNFLRHPPPWSPIPQAMEETYEFQLDPEHVITCKIDRIDSLPDGGVVIVDYKYRHPDDVAKLCEEHEKGHRIQAGVYVAALRQAGYDCKGFSFAALREGVGWKGWIPDVEDQDRESLQDMCQKAIEAARRALQLIEQGHVAPRPASQEICQRCSYKDICRIEAVQPALVAAEARAE